MNSLGEKTHSFIVRIWLESREIKGKAPEWRGMIEHVTSGDRHYFQDIAHIPILMEPYLKKMGINDT